MESMAFNRLVPLQLVFEGELSLDVEVAAVDRQVKGVNEGQ